MARITPLDFVSKKIGSWRILRFTKSNLTMDCLCDCGNTKTYSYCGVKKFTEDSSCGCKSKHPYPKQGDIYPTHNGDVEVLSRENCNKIRIRFVESGYECTTAGKELRSGNIANPLAPSVYGVGIVGVGKYKTGYTGVDGQLYRAWNGMVQRCYSRDGNFLLENPTYINATMDETWLQYQVFGDWYYNQVGCCDKTHVDKDLLMKGNKHYGPNTVVLVPPAINMFLVGNDADRGIYPKGVTAHGKGWRAQCSLGRGSKHRAVLVYSVQEAWLQYKVVKEGYAKTLAAKWQFQIDPRAYQALMSYEVLITD
jgi:hypothetical protein